MDRYNTASAMAFLWAEALTTTVARIMKLYIPSSLGSVLRVNVYIANNNSSHNHLQRLEPSILGDRPCGDIISSLTGESPRRWDGPGQSSEPPSLRGSEICDRHSACSGQAQKTHLSMVSHSFVYWSETTCSCYRPRLLCKKMITSTA